MASGPPPRRDSADPSLSDWTLSAQHTEATSGRPPAPAAEGGFTPGTVLAARYRVVARLGRGGMGEVYRADDLKLGQAVALKFVRGALSPEVLKRLYSEVALGRQVSHPSVCRLYDVVEVEPETFLAMEYVDGEDLQSLLARIGRLPPDKALEIARDLCSGLAAVHEKGIIHRDLKPANVMIDGRGRARITDFGLAVVAQESGQYAFVGTPAYMSPEQLTGGEVTPRSDLYAFGLILFEMATGQRFFDAKSEDALVLQHRESKGPRLSSASRFLDPAAERLVVQCVEEDPRNRPSSARALLALLPGMDPLEAAVAAGETPSPELVAAAATVGDLSAGKAWLALATVIGGLVLAPWLADQTGYLQRTLLPKTPEVMADRAREVLGRLAPDRMMADEAYSFEWDVAYLGDVGAHDRSPDRWQKLATKPFPPLYFYYRQSPRKLIAANRDGMVRADDPPVDVSGMAEVVLTSRGQLLSFLTVPPQRDTGEGPWPEPDWSTLLRETALDGSTLHAVAPQWASPVDSDRKAAWEGAYGAGEDGVPVRIEAASYHGRPVWFAVLPPWMKATRMAARGGTPPTPVGEAGVWLLALAMPLGGVLLARHNLRLGRVDRKGAFRVALFVFVSYTLARLFRADHVAAFGDELWILIKILAYPAFWAAQVWLLYTALEPYVRRRWPHMLISWKRLLGGAFDDPMVGRDVLLGAVVGMVLIVFFLAGLVAPRVVVPIVPVPIPPGLAAPFLQGPTLTFLSQVFFRLFVNAFSAVLFAMVFLFILTLLRMVLRRDWLASLAWAAIVAAPIAGENPTLGWVGGAFRALMMLVVLRRGGLLSLAVALFFMFSLIEVPITLDLGAWYAPRALPVVIVLAGLAAYGFRASLGGKPLFGSSLLDD
ncbi:MAG TPA: serine/threonine-protein kinase [Vicinamibacteria bacterium]|nr:serine/threonine-protein kinase [Vicinamibacteria bacterium]